MFLHLHIIHGFPLSLTQRDQDGLQKRFSWGSSKRPYYSSAVQKRETRMGIEMELPAQMRAVRTRQHQQVAARLVADHGWSPSLASEATRALWARMNGGKGDLDADGGMAFLRADALDLMTEAAVANRELMELLARAEFAPAKPDKSASREEKDEYKTDKERYDAAVEALKDKDVKDTIEQVCNELLDVSGNVSVAMFGRMIAARPNHNVDAAFGCAHAIGLEPWHDSNIDFFSAVDDLAEGGASGHISDADLSTNEYYRYAWIDIAQLCKNLGYESPDKDIAKWVTDAVEGIVLALPQSKQSSTGANAYPTFVGADMTESARGNLANLFARPVHPGRDTSVNHVAAQRIINGHAKQRSVYAPGTAPLRYITVLDGLDSAGDATDLGSLEAMTETIRNEIAA